jgi:osmotically-inducible protein OsmY
MQFHAKRDGAGRKPRRDAGGAEWNRVDTTKSSRGRIMNTRMKKIIMAGALIAAASAVSAQAADVSAASPDIADDPPAAEDQRINNDVIVSIANDSSLDGKIAVHTEDGVVTLTGLVTTPGQIDRVLMDTTSVAGVRDVDNQVDAQVGMNF